MPFTSKMKKITSFILLLLSAVSVFAQGAEPVPMADELNKSGKIYVVIVTIVIVFAGLAVYLFSMDRRLKRLEKEKDI